MAFSVSQITTMQGSDVLRSSTSEEARRALSASPFFSTWDTDALSIYVECGLCDDLNGGITLKMPGTQVCLFHHCGVVLSVMNSMLFPGGHDLHGHADNVRSMGHDRYAR